MVICSVCRKVVDNGEYCEGDHDPDYYLIETDPRLQEYDDELDRNVRRRLYERYRRQAGTT